MQAPLVVTILPAQSNRDSESDFGSLRGTAYINVISHALPIHWQKSEDILSLLERGTDNPFRALPLTGTCECDSAVDLKRLRLDLRKLPGAGRFKVICVGVLALAACAAYALTGHAGGHTRR